MKHDFHIHRKKSVLIILYICYSICCIPMCGADELKPPRIEIPSSTNPVGSGARALGMGGAFIAVADDATAASWNPGGLIQLDTPEASVVGAYFHRIEDNSFGTDPMAGGNQTVFATNINYLSASYPFELFHKNMILSLSYQNLYDFTRKWNFNLSSDFEAAKLSSEQYIDYQQDGSLSAIGVSYSVRINRDFSVGFTLNIWDDKISPNNWEQKTHQFGEITSDGNKVENEYYQTDHYSFRGINANFGILWNITGKLTLGVVLKTPFNADVEHEQFLYSFLLNPDLLDGSKSKSSSTDNMTLKMPMSYGVGFAYRFSDEFTASLDIYRTQWNDFVLKDSNGKETSPITSEEIGKADISPTYQVRLGAEYLFISPSQYLIPLRAGIFYDPAPAKDTPDDIFGISIGSGIIFRKFGRYVFDIAYQYRFGKDVGTSILQNWQYSQDISEHTLYSSLIVHF